MQPLLHTLTIIALLALLLLSIVTFPTHVRFLRRLRLNHETTWHELGEPSTFWPGLRRLRYAHWMWFRGFAELQDPELTSLGSRVMDATVAAIALVLVFVVCAFFAGFLTWR
jgi:hypothetical protein